VEIGKASREVERRDGDGRYSVVVSKPPEYVDRVEARSDLFRQHLAVCCQDIDPKEGGRSSTYADQEKADRIRDPSAGKRQRLWFNQVAGHKTVRWARGDEGIGDMPDGRRVRRVVGDSVDRDAPDANVGIDLELIKRFRADNLSGAEEALWGGERDDRPAMRRPSIQRREQHISSGLQDVHTLMTWHRGLLRRARSGGAHKWPERRLAPRR